MNNKTGLAFDVLIRFIRFNLWFVLLDFPLSSWFACFAVSVSFSPFLLFFPELPAGGQLNPVARDVIAQRAEHQQEPDEAQTGPYPGQARPVFHAHEE